MQQTKWFERKFNLISDNGLFENILERLEGTPGRVESIFRNSNSGLTDLITDSAWSAKEEVGHLLDLEPLWLGRFQDFSDQLEMLRSADLENRKTHEANHNETPISKLLVEFREARTDMLRFIRNKATDLYLEQSALHPRLLTPMRPIDLAFFIAEHDDHHLVKIRSLLSG